jgi:hypothetical protein
VQLGNRSAISYLKSADTRVKWRRKTRPSTSNACFEVLPLWNLILDIGHCRTKPTQQLTGSQARRELHSKFYAASWEYRLMLQPIALICYSSPNPCPSVTAFFSSLCPSFLLYYLPFTSAM